MNIETFYQGRDNRTFLELKEGAATIADLSAVTRWEVVLSKTGVSVTLSSATDAGVFAVVSEADLIAGGSATLHLLQLDIGAVDWAAKGLTFGTYTARLIVYDPSHSDGLVWTSFPVALSA